MDLDSADAGDPAQVSEYAADIFAHFKSEELTKSAKHGYMAGQSDINEKVRRATAPQGPRRTRERWGPGVVREHIIGGGSALASPRREAFRGTATHRAAPFASPAPLSPSPQMRAILIVSRPRRRPRRRCQAHGSVCARRAQPTSAALA